MRGKNKWSTGISLGITKKHPKGELNYCEVTHGRNNFTRVNLEWMPGLRSLKREEQDREVEAGISGQGSSGDRIGPRSNTSNGVRELGLEAVVEGHWSEYPTEMSLKFSERCQCNKWP